ncbi:hypothetical protein TRAPUB_9890 [Trametes pubescens]|uniref:Uncharacterized protein n=1 Tax=Trametes pubescens TaxID=154538 RepID=A0A1M2W163_TRAPU|nr:hypothetical protein TRAPUB_9890 [Trametes pubescens]
MSTYAIQHGSAGASVKQFLDAGLKMAGYSVITIFSVLGAHALRDHLYREQHMKDTVSAWLDILLHLEEKEKVEIGPDHLICMIHRLEQLNMRLSVLSISLHDATMWSRAAGEHADRLRKVERLVDIADDDLRVSAILRRQDGVSKHMSVEAPSEQAKVGHLLPFADNGSPERYYTPASTRRGSYENLPALLTDGDKDPCISRVTGMTTAAINEPDGSVPSTDSQPRAPWRPTTSLSPHPHCAGPGIRARHWLWAFHRLSE